MIFSTYVFENAEIYKRRGLWKTNFACGSASTEQTSDQSANFDNSPNPELLLRTIWAMIVSQERLRFNQHIDDFWSFHGMLLMKFRSLMWIVFQWSSSCPKIIISLIIIRLIWWSRATEDRHSDQIMCFNGYLRWTGWLANCSEINSDRIHSHWS